MWVTISDGEVSKSILQSNIFPLLKDHVRIVFLAHKEKVAYYATRFGSESVQVETMPKPDSSLLEEMWSDLFLYSLHTKSIRVKIEHSYRIGGTLLGKWIKLVLWQLGRFSWYRWFFKFLYRLMSDHSFDALFEGEKPDLVFAANLTSGEDARLLKAARARGIPTIGMPKGWDNLTLKTLLPVFPDQLLVQTSLMKDDAKKLGYPEKDIRVVGFPKFDIYADTSVLSTREEFLTTLGLDPSRKLILYAGAGDQLAPHDEEILSDFLLAIERGDVPDSPNVIVRPHPKYRYRTEIVPPRPFWIVDRPGKVLGMKSGEFEFDRSDIIHLMNSLAHADLLIHTASTLGVEACIFDKPTIALAYDGSTQTSPALSTARYYEYDHVRRVITTGGMKVASSFEDLLRYTNEYLKHPEEDRAGRKKIVAENAYAIDGGAGERVANEVLSMLDK